MASFVVAMISECRKKQEKEESEGSEWRSNGKKEKYRKHKWAGRARVPRTREEIENTHMRLFIIQLIKRLDKLMVIIERCIFFFF